MTNPVRKFFTGATRDVDTNKADFEGFLSPLVLRRYGEYMNRHRVQSDGSLRDSDNWQRGIPLDAYMKSGFRHFMDWWSGHRGHKTSTGESVEEELCALIFNASGYLHELLKSNKRGEECLRQEGLPAGYVLAAHPMAAEALRDEFQRDDQGTGV